MVVSRSELAAAIPAGALPATEVFVRAPVSADAAIRAAIATRLPGEVNVTDQAGWLAGTQGAPNYTAVVFGLAAASVVAAVYGALAILAALWLTGAEQALESAHLRVLGLSGRQSLGVSALEHGPAALLVTVAGVALGVGLFLFLRPSLGLGSLVGGDIDIGLPVRPEQVGLLLVAIGAIVALAVAIETAAQARINAVSALRRGIE
jgi:hypothetical protein